jgi:hypothetical protein
MKMVGLWDCSERECEGGRDMLCVMEQYLAVGICFGNALPVL